MADQPKSNSDSIKPGETFDVLVTGGTSGLGAAFAQQYCAEGMSVVITGRREDALNRIARTINERQKGVCRVLVADLTDQTQLTHLKNLIYSNKTLKALVNNAGFNVDAPFTQLSNEERHGLISTHVSAVTELTHAALPHLLKNKGDLILVASLAAILPTPHSPLYGPTKAYIKSLGDTLFTAYRKSGLKVLTLCPGFFRSDFHEKLGLEPDQFYRKRGLFKAFSAEEVASQARYDLRRGRRLSIKGWNYRALYLFARYLPESLMIGLIQRQESARPGNNP